MSATEFIAILEDLFADLTEIYDSMKGIKVDKFSLACAKVDRMETIETEWKNTKFEILKYNSTCTDPKAKVPLQKYAFGNVIDSIRCWYYELKEKKENESQAASASNANVAPPATLSSPNSNVARLPKLSIPIFDGVSLSEWNSFYALYESLVHKNGSLSDVQKFQYLRSLLKGNALKLIENIHLSEPNYNVAYDLLTKRYQNKRLLATHYIKQIEDFKPIPNASPANLQKFLSVFKSNFDALKALSLPDTTDFVMFHNALSHLDHESRQLFETENSNVEIPSFDELIKFVEGRLKINTLCDADKFKTSSSNSVIKRPNPKNVGNSFLGTCEAKSNFAYSCPFCNDAHKPQECSKLLKGNINDRYALVRAHNRCLACLGKHYVKNCSSKASCKECHSAYHHTLLHRPKAEPQSADAPAGTSSVVNEPTVDVQSTTNALSCSSSSHGLSVLLGTVQAFVTDFHGVLQPVRIVVDTGSQISCITDACANRLGLKRMKSNMTISGISNVPSSKPLGTVSFEIFSNTFPQRKVAAKAVVLNKIAGKLPMMTLDSKHFAQFSKFPLADPLFFESRDVDILLGSDLYCDILTNEPHVPGKPCGLPTIFGMVVLGEISSLNGSNAATSLLSCVDSFNLQKFWEIEEVSVKHVKDPLDVLCEKQFLSTTSRNSEGRFVVSLPWKDDAPPLGNNRMTAMNRFINLEKRLANKPDLKRQYSDFLYEYEQLGHMQPATIQSSYVIPHHFVLKESSTTALRVVFDGSAKDDTGVSLNERLLKGEKLQKNIGDIIFGFRLFKIALTCDIRKMYRQILVHPDDRKFQHIFWRDSPDKPIVEYELNTVTYGLTSSPFQSQRSLMMLVEQDGSPYKLASRALSKQTFVDDIVGGADSEAEALQLYAELTELLGKAGFFPRKWCCSSNNVLLNIPAEHCEVPLSLREQDDVTTKVLGLQYNSKNDCFSYSFNEVTLPPTKRVVLSQIARVYDPLGWLGPVVFWAKYFIQALWRAELGWDDPLPSDLLLKWNEFANELHLLQELQIPRLVPARDSNTHVVGFCDASTRGYSAIIYFVCISNTNVSTHLLACKSRIAPLRTISLPRLELCAALLLCRLYASLKPLLESVQVQSLRFFSDSTIVLSWIHMSPHLLSTFVSHRITEIGEHVSPSVWGKVYTKINPADLPSRGMLPSEFMASSLWWNGPEFLMMPPEDWPPSFQEIESVDSLPEVKNVMLVQSSTDVISDLIARCSTLPRLLRVTAYVLRFISNVRKPRQDRSSGHLTVMEIRRALLCCVKIVQQKHFAAEFKLLSQGKCCSRTLQPLTPFVDGDGFLRVGGRLQNSDLNYATKHPVLLPRKDPLTQLICNDLHVNSLHAGPGTMQALLQKNFWVLGARNLLRQTVFKCAKCYKFKAQPVQPKMADLPPSRFSNLRCFLNTGLDFCGPFNVKSSKRRNAPTSKAYVCIFVCMSVKAVHIELVSDLTTPAFLACLDRFVARRGLCLSLYSDNGTNFVGASREIRNFIANNDAAIHHHLLQKQISWKFNCPSASNFGGLFEAAVKSCKFHLSRVVGAHSLTYEEMTTVLVRIESILNSRPLCPLSSDPNDGNDFLSPGHFLIGAPLMAVPEPNVENVPENRLTRWELLHQMLQCFWRRWKNEYLSTLMKRTKWHSSSGSFQVGDTALLSKLDSTPLNWPLGRITELFTGHDGVTRVARIKIGSSTYVRPLNKLVKFPPPAE